MQRFTSIFEQPPPSPLIVAEMSANHGQNLDQVRRWIDAAADAGADAIKLQTFRPEWLTLDSEREEFLIQNPSSPWHGRRLFELYAESALPLDWHEPIFAMARERDMAAFSAPFSLEAVAFLEEVGCPAYKIASFECVDVPLVDAVAATGKPVIISTGMATVAEVDEAVRTVRAHQERGPALLKCTSSYPAPVDACNLRTLTAMRDMWNVPVGLSDHTLSDAPAAVAVAQGAVVIEKHMTLSRSDGGLDSAFSLEPEEFKRMAAMARDAYSALGTRRLGPSTDAEHHARTRRRSLYVSSDASAGDLITADNIRSVRPGAGLATRHYKTVLGKQFRRDVSAGQPLSWSDIE